LSRQSSREETEQDTVLPASCSVQQLTGSISLISTLDDEETKMLHRSQTAAMEDGNDREQRKKSRSLVPKYSFAQQFD
jgi:hypothetical protein